MNVLEEHGITFNQERHLYFQKGFPLLSVTQVLPFDSEHITVEVLRHAAERGRRVHKWIELTETFDAAAAYAVVETGDLPFCEAWADFKHKTGFELARLSVFDAPSIPLVETFVYHPLYGYVGRLDLLGYLRRILGIENDLTLVDAKAVAAISPTTALQTAAYMQAINPWRKARKLPEVKHRWAAHLLPTGRCKRESYPDHKGDFSVFLAYLNVTRWETRQGMRKLLEDPFTAPAAVDEEVDALAARFV